MMAPTDSSDSSTAGTRRGGGRDPIALASLSLMAPTDGSDALAALVQLAAAMSPPTAPGPASSWRNGRKARRFGGVSVTAPTNGCVFICQKQML